MCVVILTSAQIIFILLSQQLDIMFASITMIQIDNQRLDARQIFHRNAAQQSRVSAIQSAILNL